LLGLEVLLREEVLSPRGVEMIEVLRRGVRKEAEAIEELLRSTELFEKDAAQNRYENERATGIEPALPAWKAGTLPLSYARVGY
jgi:hypothetical protein